jgi:hypothetical protein
VDTDPAHYTWWLDVESENTWQPDSDAGQARNRASLEGMAAYLITRGGEVGVYAVPGQWREIVGTVTWDSNLYRLDSWIPGASTAAGAAANCRRSPLTNGGDVAIAQYVSGDRDMNVAC